MDRIHFARSGQLANKIIQTRQGLCLTSRGIGGITHAAGQAPRDNRDRQEHEEGEHLLRIGDRERVDRRNEEEIVCEEGQERRCEAASRAEPNGGEHDEQ